MSQTFATLDVLECKVFTRYGGAQNQINALHYVVQQITGANPNLVTLAQSLSTSIGTAYAPFLSSVQICQGIQLRRVLPTVTQTVVATNATGTGTRIGDALAPQLAPITTLRSSDAPRKVRGRIYWPSLCEPDEDVNGKVAASGLASMTTLFNAISSFTALAAGSGTTADLALVLYSKLHQTKYIIDQNFNRTAFGTQRRRSLVNRGDAPLA